MYRVYCLLPLGAAAWLRHHHHGLRCALAASMLQGRNPSHAAGYCQMLSYRNQTVPASLQPCGTLAAGIPMDGIHNRSRRICILLPRASSSTPTSGSRRAPAWRRWAPAACTCACTSCSRCVYSFTSHGVFFVFKLEMRTHAAFSFAVLCVPLVPAVRCLFVPRGNAWLCTDTVRHVVSPFWHTPVVQPLPCHLNHRRPRVRLVMRRRWQ